MRQAQTESFAAAQQLSRARNEIISLDLQKEGNAARLEKLSAEKAQLEEERTGLAARLQQFSASVEAEKLNAQTHRGTLEERQQRLRAIQEELAAHAGNGRLAAPAGGKPLAAPPAGTIGRGAGRVSARARSRR